MVGGFSTPSLTDSPPVMVRLNLEFLPPDVAVVVRCVDLAAFDEELLDGRAFARAVIDDRRAARAPTVRETIAQEIHPPAQIRTLRLGQWTPFIRSDSLALAATHRQLSM